MHISFSQLWAYRLPEDIFFIKSENDVRCLPPSLHLNFVPRSLTELGDHQLAGQWVSDIPLFIYPPRMGLKGVSPSPSPSLSMGPGDEHPEYGCMVWEDKIGQYFQVLNFRKYLM